MPEVANCTGNVVIPAVGTGMLVKGEWLEYPPQYFVQHLSVCSPLLIQPPVRKIVLLDWNR
jgi:hypothetical protein